MKPNSRNDPVFKPAADSLLPSKAQAKFSEGKRLHQNGQLARARQIYQQVLESQPDNSDVLLLLGVISYQTNNPAHAVELISKAIEINPDNGVAHSNLGVVLNSLKRHQAAVDSYDNRPATPLFDSRLSPSATVSSRRIRAITIFSSWLHE